MHSGIRPYFCHRCGLNFTQERNRKRHLEQEVCGTKMIDYDTVKFNVEKVSKDSRAKILQAKYIKGDKHTPFDKLKGEIWANEILKHD